MRLKKTVITTPHPLQPVVVAAIQEKGPIDRTDLMCYMAMGVKQLASYRIPATDVLGFMECQGLLVKDSLGRFDLSESAKKLRPGDIIDMGGVENVIVDARPNGLIGSYDPVHGYKVLKPSEMPRGRILARSVRVPERAGDHG